MKRAIPNISRVPSARSPRPGTEAWSAARRNRLLETLRDADGVSAAMRAGSIGWAELSRARARSSAIASAVQQAHERQIERLEQMLADVATDALSGTLSEVDPALKLGVSIGQWLLKNRLPVVSRAAEPGQRVRQRPSQAEHPAPQADNPMDDEARIVAIIAEMEARIQKG